MFQETQQGLSQIKQFVDFAQIASPIIAIAALWYLTQQIKVSRRINTAQFISSLESEFSGFQETYARLLPKKRWSSESKNIAPSVIPHLLVYLAFFGKMEHLIQYGAIRIETFNELFAYRFFLIVHNRHAQENILYNEQYRKHWVGIYRLHYRLTEFRKNNNFEKGKGIELKYKISGKNKCYWLERLYNPDSFPVVIEIESTEQ